MQRTKASPLGENYSSIIVRKGSNGSRILHICLNVFHSNPRILASLNPKARPWRDSLFHFTPFPIIFEPVLLELVEQGLVAYLQDARCLQPVAPCLVQGLLDQIDLHLPGA